LGYIPNNVARVLQTSRGYAVIAHNTHSSAEEEAMLRLLENPKPPDVVIIAYGLIAIGVIKALRESELRVL
jgi:DNA-binding LacI/PurR family transcriptional regulator